MATKQQVIDLNREHPDWTAARIAAEIGCGAPYVHATARRNGLILASGREVTAVNLRRRAENLIRWAESLIRRAERIEAQHNQTGRIESDDH